MQVQLAAAYRELADANRDKEMTMTGQQERTQRAWMIRVGAEGQYEDRFIETGRIGLGWDQIPDLKEFTTKEDLREAIEAEINATPQTVGRYVGQLWRLRSEVSAGDLVVLKHKTKPPRITLGVVTSGYRYQADVDKERECNHVVQVEWKRNDIPITNIQDDLSSSFRPRWSLYEIRTADAVWRLGRIIEAGSDPGARQEIGDTGEARTGADDHGASASIPEVSEDALDSSDIPEASTSALETLAEELMWDVSFLRRIERLLSDKGQAIFQGPPGTGKTYVSRKLAECLAGSSDRVRLVQFHPSYSYEDFVQGFRPTLKNGRPGFEIRNGPLLDAAEAARMHPGWVHILIIDEINRGNLSTVLGELYFLLEYRNADMQLKYSDDKISLPENLWIIGTMNTADLSIAPVDVALRRRFHFFEFRPDKPPVEGLLRRWLAEHAPRMSWIADAVDRANEKLPEPQAAIGPSYFMKRRPRQRQSSLHLGTQRPTLHPRTT